MTFREDLTEAQTEGFSGNMPGTGEEVRSNRPDLLGPDLPCYIRMQSSLQVSEHEAVP